MLHQSAQVIIIIYYTIMYDCIVDVLDASGMLFVGISKRWLPVISPMVSLTWQLHMILKANFDPRSRISVPDLP